MTIRPHLRIHRYGVYIKIQVPVWYLVAPDVRPILKMSDKDLDLGTKWQVGVEGL